jgi:hypothetical protein
MLSFSQYKCNWGCMLINTFVHIIIIFSIFAYILGYCCNMLLHSSEQFCGMYLNILFQLNQSSYAKNRWIYVIINSLKIKERLQMA